MCEVWFPLLAHIQIRNQFGKVTCIHIGMQETDWVAFQLHIYRSPPNGKMMPCQDQRSHTVPKKERDSSLGGFCSWPKAADFMLQFSSKISEVWNLGRSPVSGELATPEFPQPGAAMEVRGVFGRWNSTVWEASELKRLWKCRTAEVSAFNMPGCPIRLTSFDGGKCLICPRIHPRTHRGITLKRRQGWCSFCERGHGKAWQR